MHDEDCDDPLCLHWLAIRSIRGRVDNNLSLLHWLNHGLLHWHHVAWRLHTWLSHVHLSHTSWVTLPIHKHLLLGSSLLIELALTLVIIPLARFTIDNCRLTKRTSHLAWHANLRHQTLIHLRCLIGVSRHSELLLIHEWLLMLMSLVLVHATLTATVRALAWDGLTKFVHTVSIGTVV